MRYVGGVLRYVQSSTCYPRHGCAVWKALLPTDRALPDIRSAPSSTDGMHDPQTRCAYIPLSPGILCPQWCAVANRLPQHRPYAKCPSCHC